MLPLFLIINCRVSWFHSPSFIKSLTKYLFKHTNSPDNTRLLYRLLLNGSNDSLFPKIWLVLAVGIGATNKLFLVPYIFTCSLNSVKSYYFGSGCYTLDLVVILGHMSNDKIPFDRGLPSKLDYFPNCLARSTLSVSAACYMHSNIFLLVCLARSSSKATCICANKSAMPWTPMPMGLCFMFDVLASSIGY